MEYAPKLLQMLHVLVNHNFTPDWVKDKDYLIYDRSDSREYLKDFNQSKIVYEKNVGQVDYPKLRYLVDNYETLPDVFLWSKSNLFKFITNEEYGLVKGNGGFTPLLTNNHRTYSDSLMQVCFYDEGVYWERVDVAQAAFSQFSWKTCETWDDFAKMFDLPTGSFIPFAPGGSYILTRETVHKHPKELYERMANMLPHAKEPREAQMCERAYYLLWR